MSGRAAAITTMARARRGQRRHASNAAIAATPMMTGVEPSSDARRATHSSQGVRASMTAS